MSEKSSNNHGDWVLFRRGAAFPDYGGQPLYLSTILVSQLVSERLAREQAELAAKKQMEVEAARQLVELERQRQDESAKANAAAIAGAKLRENAVDWHVVFADYAAAHERLIDLRNGMFGAGDDSHAKRETMVLERALSKGDYRPVVRRPTWRKDLEALANEMPAFRAAIDVVVRAWDLSELLASKPVVPPLLLVGPPGVGKSRFCRRLAEVLGTGLGWLGMDQHTAGCDLRGTDAHWSTSRHGKLFELLALGHAANPLMVLDEIDKARRSDSSQGIDMLGQLYGALEPETARSLIDASLNVALDASQVMYIATANSLEKIDEPLLSRFEVIAVDLPDQAQRRQAAEGIVMDVARRLHVRGMVNVWPGCYVLLADYSPRVIVRAAERAISDAVRNRRTDVRAADFEEALGIASTTSPVALH
jgi:ATP-dependent Lon protease